MFLQLNHQQLEVFKTSHALAVECYKVVKLFPSYERFEMGSQIRRAALSVHLNIAEGCSRRSESERKRYFEISRGSLIELDAAFDVAHDLNYLKAIDTTKLSNKTITTFKLLCGLLRK